MWVSIWVVVVVVVRELFSPGTSAICVRIRGHRSEVTRIVYHMGQVYSGLVGTISTLFCYANIKFILFFLD